MAASSSNHHSPRGNHVGSPSFDQKTSVPYAKVVSGESIGLQAVPLAVDIVNDNLNTVECGGSDGNDNNVVVTKPVWNKVSNEAGPVMGAVSWPALSECTSKVSSRSNDADNSSPVSNAVLPAPQGPKTPKAQGAAGSSNNPGSRHASNGRPRQSKRGSNSTANGPRPAQGGFVRAPPSQQPPPAPLPIQVPASSQLPSPSLTPPPFPLLDYSQGNYGFIPRGEAPYPRPMPGFAPSHNPFSQRSPSRRPRGEGPYNNNQVGRPDFSPRTSNGRDVRMQYPPRAGNFMRHPPPTFIAPPPLMTFNEMRQPFIIFPSMVPDHLRSMPFISREPTTSPMGFPSSDVTLPNLLLNQINFYFSDANLERDEYLRSQMDEGGWVPITVIASFARVRQLTHDMNIILEALQPSTVVEVKDSKIRKLNEWKKYVNFHSGGKESESELKLELELQKLQVGGEGSSNEDVAPISKEVISSSPPGTD